jgi:hypothetical protein
LISGGEKYCEIKKKDFLIKIVINFKESLALNLSFLPNVQMVPLTPTHRNA